MAQSKHTPGPWAVNPQSAQVDAFDSGFPVPVCRMLWPTDERTEDETEANARLISAAPELLGALIRATDSAQADYDSGCRAASFHNNSDACKGGNYMSDPSLPDWFSDALAAIAKATGDE